MIVRPQKTKQQLRYNDGADSEHDCKPASKTEIDFWPSNELPITDSSTSDVEETDSILYVFDDAPGVTHDLKGILRPFDAPRKHMRKVRFSKDTVFKPDVDIRKKNEKLEQIYAAANDSPMINQTYFVDDGFPEFNVVPFHERPSKTDLEAHAVALNYASYLTTAAGHRDPVQRMNRFLLFMHFYCANLQQFAESLKPLRSFPGETFDVDKEESHDFKAIFEQVTIDTVAMHVVGKDWTMTLDLSTLPLGEGFLGGGSFVINCTEEIGFTFKVEFCHLHYSEKEQRYMWFETGDVSASCAFSNCVGKLYFNDNEEKLIAKSQIRNDTTKILFKGTRIGKAVIQFKHGFRPDGRYERKTLSKVNPVGRVVLKQFVADTLEQPTEKLPLTDSRFRTDIELMLSGKVDNAEDCYNWMCEANQKRTSKKPKYFICRNVKDQRFYEFKQGYWGPSYYQSKENNFEKAVKRRRIN